MTQNEQIKNHLEAGKPITPMEALTEYGCFRLGARIYDLRREGLAIDRDMVKQGEKTFARYRLA